MSWVLLTLLAVPALPFTRALGARVAQGYDYACLSYPLSSELAPPEPKYHKLELISRAAVIRICNFLLQSSKRLVQTRIETVITRKKGASILVKILQRSCSTRRPTVEEKPTGVCGPVKLITGQ